jgi:hypothetical protein
LVAVVVEPPLPPSVEARETQTPATSVPPTAAVTVPEILAPTTISALMPVAGDVTVGATANAPDIDDAPVAVLLYHCGA